MTTLFKIIVAFGCILFLVSNSRAGTLDLETGMVKSCETENELSLHMQQDSRFNHIRF